MIHYENLDKRTREFMLRELDMDLADGTLYLSPRLNKKGRGNYPSLLREAIISHDDVWLADQLRGNKLIKAYEQRRNPGGGYTKSRVPHSAADTLAEGEFNRFFIRGLCARALEEGIKEVQVYRGKAVRNRRPESEALIGTKKKARNLLDDLRANPGAGPVLGLPPGPNSGLTVHILRGFGG
ncbi:MAG TPA: hypothetical protein VMC85_06345 [Desulfomonilaceae bacterium]|nr:hypothetical protein [Desulfomonilaceae bacterium]